MSTFRFLLHDAVSGAIVGEVRPTMASWDSALNAPGGASIVVPAQEYVRAAGGQPRDGVGRLTMTVIRDAAPEWSGLIWGATVDLQAGTVALAASGILSLLQKRVVRLDLTYTNVEQTTIAAALVNHGQATSGGMIGARPDRALRISTTGLPATGVTRTVAYRAIDAQPIAEALTQLAQQDNGFDFAIAPVIGAGLALTHSLQITAPNTGPMSSLVLAHRSNCAVRTVDVSAVAMLTDVKARGADDLSTFVTSTNTGYPAMEENVAWSDLEQTAALTAAANRRLVLGGVPTETPTLAVVETDAIVPLGHRFRLIASEAGVDGTFRAVGTKTAVQGSAAITELTVVTAAAFGA